ncbi:hypothetical protein HPB52_008933 [Rhipicephalus sanguineus]|uniref:Uncharacterized protein n=1 Tax=Rhipicephalus sanguineus TaxID=34632 RepID=A0A9D4T5G0_RHISA|nr:hypothetical protein HPB52_008933 [Rhipicephalus sanguineus]
MYGIHWHPDWGYLKADGPRTRLWQLAQDLNLSLHTDPRQPTFIGNSVCHDTTPDLSFCRSLRDARSSNTHQSSAPRPHMAHHTDRDAFRQRRLHSAALNIEDLSMWTSKLLAHRRSASSFGGPSGNRLPPCPPVGRSHGPNEPNTPPCSCQQWEQLCSALSGQLGSKQTWHFLHHLLNPASAKSEAWQQLERVIRAYPATLRH